MSKPYMLKVFDAKVSAKHAFYDMPGVCKLMMKDCRDCQSLLQVCSESEVESVATAKVESLIVENLLL